MRKSEYNKAHTVRSRLEADGRDAFRVLSHDSDTVRCFAKGDSDVHFTASVSHMFTYPAVAML